MKNKSVFIILVSILSLTSCLEQPQVELVKRDLDLIDSLYALNRDSLSALADSLCLDNRERLYTQLVDSMILRQRQDIQSIIER